MTTEPPSQTSRAGVPDRIAEVMAFNEAACRRVNEAIVAGRRGREATFLCECSAVSCNARLTLSVDEYEAVRTSFVRFLLVPGHEDVVDRVTEDHGRYLVVEKVGAAVPVVRATDPRSAGR